MTTNSVTFSTLPIWLQVWGLPFDLMNEEAGWEIGKGLGHVVEVDKKNIPIRPGTHHQDPDQASTGEIDSAWMMGCEPGR